MATKKANDSSYKYNTDTGKLNPNYKAPTIKTTTNSSSSSSSSSASVKAIQTQINQMGKGVPGFKPLVVDGIQGTRTNSEMARFGIGAIGAATAKFAANKVAQNIKSSIPVPTTQASSYGTKPSNFSSNKYGLPDSTIGMPTKSKKSILQSIGDVFSGGSKAIKDALGLQTSNAYEGYINNGVSTTDKIMNAIPIVGQIYDQVKGTTSYSPYGTDPLAWQPEAQNFAPIATEPNSSTMSLDITGTGADAPINPDIAETSIAGTDTTLTKTSTDPNTGEVTTFSQNSPLGSQALVGSPGGAPMNNSQIGDAAKNARLALKTDMAGATWNPNTTNNSEFQTGQLVSYADKFAKGFNTQQEATNYFNSAVGKADVGLQDYIAKGGKVQDIINKVQPVTNGVVGPQTVDQYLLNTQGTPAALKAEADAVNQSIINDFQWTDAQKKYLDNNVQGEVLGLLQQTQKESDERVRLLNLQALRKETSERERSDILVQTARNQFDSDSAKLEQNRIKGRNSMIGLLAKLGALNTTSGSGFAIEEVESKYTQMQQDLKGSFSTSMNEIEYNMNTRINTLQDDLDDKVFTINQDLSKTERDVRMEKMKLDQQFKKDVNSANTDWAKEIRTENRRASDKAESNANNYSNALWKIMNGSGLPIPESVARTMINSKGDIIATQANQDLYQSYNPAKKPETVPDYKGEKLKSLTIKLTTGLEDLGYDSNNLIQVQRDLNAGWSLDQIAKNNNMPEDMVNYIRTKLLQ